MSNPKTEWEVAKQAEKMLTQALRDSTSSFKNHVSRNPVDKSIKTAQAITKTKRYGSKATGDLTHYVRSVAIRMPRHGFIQNFGIKTIRKGTRRTRLHPQQTTYGVKEHLMQMDAKPFITSSIEKSKVIPYVIENLTRLRSEEIMAGIKAQFEGK